MVATRRRVPLIHAGRRAPRPPACSDAVAVHYCWRWNGASNAADCAYSGGFTINADKAGIEGIVDRPAR